MTFVRQANILTSQVPVSMGIEQWNIWKIAWASCSQNVVLRPAVLASLGSTLEMQILSPYGQTTKLEPL